jgi:predicted phosphodiesterase
MKLAVLSDAHGNGLALEAVLDDLQREGVEDMVCLGDMVQGGPQPGEVVERLMRLGCPVVMGNADEWLLTGVESGSEAISDERRQRMEAVREWSLSRLSDEQRAFMAGFAPTAEVALADGRGLLAFHGSPASYDDLILPTTPEDDFQRMLGGHAGRILCGGHVHLPFVRRIGDSFFFNPGSVGLAYNHQQEASSFRLDAWAEYALLTTGEGAAPGRIGLEFRRVPLEVRALVRVLRESGRPGAEQAVREYGAE